MSGHILILKMGSTFPEIIQRLGDYEHWFAARLSDLSSTGDGHRSPPLAIRVHDITTGIAPEESPAAIIVTGSPTSVYDPAPWISPACDYLRLQIDSGIPVLGVCFGHQLIAHAFGGRVAKNPRGWEIGTSPVTLTPEGRQDPLLGDFESPLLVQESHQDVVIEPPPGVTVLARSPVDPHHAFRVRERVWTVQFHPEIGEAEVGALLHCRRELLHREGLERGLQPGEFVDQARRGISGSGVGERLLRRFLELALSQETLTPG